MKQFPRLAPNPNTIKEEQNDAAFYTMQIYQLLKEPLIKKLPREANTLIFIYLTSLVEYEIMQEPIEKEQAAEISQLFNTSLKFSHAFLPEYTQAERNAKKSENIHAVCESTTNFCVKYNMYGISPLDNRMSIFTSAVIMGHMHLARAMLKKGVPVDGEKSQGFETPLLALAAQQSPAKNQLDMAALLIDYGANLERWAAAPGRNALALANEFKNTKLVDFLQKVKPDVTRIRPN